MTRKEKIAEAARKYATHPTDTDVTDFHGKWVKETKYNHDEYLAFLEGSQWADENPKIPWISVKDDLPCNHEELLSAKCETKKVFILKDSFGNPDVDYMLKVNGVWRWFGYNGTKYWFPIPELPKE